MSLQVSAKRCSLSGPVCKVFTGGSVRAEQWRRHQMLPDARRKQGVSPVHSQMVRRLRSDICRRVTMQSRSWLSPRADQHRQRVNAQRRSSRHQALSCEDRASNYFEKEGKICLAGHKFSWRGYKLCIRIAYSVDVVPI